MAKFVITCPKCGKYTEASTGGFLGIGKTRKIDCVCGYTIDVKSDSVTSRVCSHCGNTVIYNQRDGDAAVCPVCHEKINTQTDLQKLVEFSCPSCSCKLSADRTASHYVCPLCETEIDVQKQIEKEAVKNKGLASIIKYEGGNDIFVWKHPIEDFNLGSQLIVHESQEAIFFRDGKALDLFGSGRYTLATQKLPILDKLYKLPTNPDEIFHSEVYFINMVTQMGIKWGTDSKVRLFDPASGLHIEIGACGNFNLRVNDSRKLLVKVVGTANQFSQKEVVGEGYGTSYMMGKFKALVMNKVKSNLARAIKEENLNILEIDSYMDTLSERMRGIINETLDEYGLIMPEFYITSILTPDDDPNFKRLKQQFADKTLLVREEEVRKAEAEAAQGRKLVEAQTEAQLKVLGAQGEAEAIKVKAQAEAEAYRMQAIAEADEMRAKGYTYQQETARQVGLEAMQNGIGGSGGGSTVSSGIGEIAGLGMTLGAMGSVMGMTKDAFGSVMNDASVIGSGVSSTMNAQAVQGADVPQNNEGRPGTWNCTCGAKGIASKFCPECGNGRPREEKPDTWDCTCGAKGITSKFCPECGSARPQEEKPDTWDCPCGTKGITSKFCPECGSRREE